MESSEYNKSPIPSTMKAWIVVRTGTPTAALQFDLQHPTPPPPSGNDINIKVSYAALNPADLVLMSHLPASLPFRWRPTPGLDFCGTVVAVGSSTPNNGPITVGACVCGAIPLFRLMTGTGTLAEFITVPADCVALKPDQLSKRAAAGLGIAGQTAVMIINEANLEPGQLVLVNGASGGVGSMMCQVLNAMGATVVGVCSGRNAEMVKKLGASEVIDYTMHGPLHEYLIKKYAQNPFDKIIDCSGNQALYDYCMPYLKEKGIFLNIVGGTTQGVFPWLKGNLFPSFLGGTPRKYKILPLSPNGKYQKEVVDWIEDGTLKEVQIDSVFPFEEALQAYEKLASKRARGKIIIKIAE